MPPERPNYREYGMRSVGRQRVAALCLALSFSIPAVNFAQDEQGVQEKQPERRMYVWGKELFGRYCATCHGQTGKGDGPLAAALKKAPADLTQIQKSKGESFSRTRLMQFIDGERSVPAHGSREMPIWGKEFRRDNPAPEVRLRLLALVTFLESIQEQ